MTTLNDLKKIAKTGQRIYPESTHPAKKLIDEQIKRIVDFLPINHIVQSELVLLIQEYPTTFENLSEIRINTDSIFAEYQPLDETLQELEDNILRVWSDYGVARTRAQIQLKFADEFLKAIDPIDGIIFQSVDIPIKNYVEDQYDEIVICFHVQKGI